MDDAKNVLKSFVPLQNEAKVNEPKYMYMKGLYITLRMIHPKDPHHPKLVQKMADENIGREHRIMEPLRRNIPYRRKTKARRKYWTYQTILLMNDVMVG